MPDQKSPPTFFKSGDCRTISHQRKSWGLVDADLVRRTGLAKEETDIKSTRHLILLNLKGNSDQGEYFLNAKPAAFIPRKPGAILFIPAGCRWKGWEVGDPTAAYLSISVDQAFVTKLFDRTLSGAPPWLSPDLGCEDSVIMNAARGIGAEIHERGPLSNLLVESYAATIFAQLVRKQKYAPPVRKGGLASANLSRVLKRIEDELAADLSLGQLAALAGLSVPHFCRAFRQTLGCPPYTFIIRRRVERAKEYLRQSSMTVTDVALVCGFSSSSHFSNVFRREVGTTPGEYRGAWKDKSRE
ncbi:helix-turn-helix domain-containing protein [Rhizobium leguminosarum]|uniref:helix-turn-helix domain-containing protein n=1 Tax=Rhizobium leguminosarum TaxID=384 RepID=UPI0024A7E2F3|nr:AraC family transcriptional regulator [Rhizobium leguminosarum]MDI5930237.1 AraC family transcriptional regulator [Rhizobium leguminosarum]